MRGAIEERLSQFFNELELADHRRKLKAIEADPKAHRTTTMMGPKGSSYRCVEGEPDHTGRRVLFCWSCWKNAAGFYLAWKEEHGDDCFKRRAFTAHRTRKAARAWSERWRDERDEALLAEPRIQNV